MEISNKSIVNQEKVILSLLCNDLYYQIKDIVNKYALKQTEKDLVNLEETMIRVIYRDFIDSDIFNDFNVLFLDDFYIINTFKLSKKGDKCSVQDVINKITEYIKSDQCTNQLKAVCAKYNHAARADRILSEAIRKIGIYIVHLTQEECDRFRQTILKLFQAILLFCAKK